MRINNSFGCFATKLRRISVVVVCVLVSLLLTGEMVHASHWPYGMLHHSNDPDESKGYFTRLDHTSALSGNGTNVLPPTNSTSPYCESYSYSEWLRDGAPTTSPEFGVPHSAISGSNDISGNAARKTQLYDFLYQTHTNNDPSTNCTAAQRHYGSSFMVHTLIGIKSPDAGGQIRVTSSEWDSLRQRLDSPDIYLVSVNDFSHSINTFLGLVGTELTNRTVNDAFAWFVSERDEPAILIREGSPTGNILYALMRLCGNPSGDFEGLPPVDPPSPPPSITCGNLITPPSRPEPSQPFIVSTSFNVEGGPGPDITYDMFFTLPVAGINNQNMASGQIVSRGSTGIGTTPNITISSPGQYEGIYTIQAPDANPSTLNCPFGVSFSIVGRPQIPVVSLPYFKIYGGDVHTGSGFKQPNGACNVNQNSGFLGYNRPGAGPFTGAGTQLAAFIMGYDIGAASGQIRDTSAPKSLTFANRSASSNNYGNNTYGGGMFGSGNGVCAPDYYGDRPSSTTSLGSSTSGTGLSAGDYYRNGNLQITGGNLSGGSNVGTRTIYVNGNVTISGNIRTPSGSYNSIDRIPGFRVVARGNIYVAPWVNEIYGIYIAQSAGGNSGRFWSCWPSGTPNEVTINGVCRTSGRLTVYGAVIAERIKLTRSNGTRLEASTSERYNNSAGNPAEVFIMTPEVWLNGGFSSSGEYDSLTSLPPVL